MIPLLASPANYWTNSRVASDLRNVGQATSLLYVAYIYIVPFSISGIILEHVWKLNTTSLAIKQFGKH